MFRIRDTYHHVQSSSPYSISKNFVLLSCSFAIVTINVVQDAILLSFMFKYIEKMHGCLFTADHLV